MRGDADVAARSAVGRVGREVDAGPLAAPRRAWTRLRLGTSDSAGSIGAPRPRVASTVVVRRRDAPRLPSVRGVPRRLCPVRRVASNGRLARAAADPDRHQRSEERSHRHRRRHGSQSPVAPQRRGASQGMEPGVRRQRPPSTPNSRQRHSSTDGPSQLASRPQSPGRHGAPAASTATQKSFRHCRSPSQTGRRSRHGLFAPPRRTQRQSEMPCSRHTSSGPQGCPYMGSHGAPTARVSRQVP